MGEVVTQCSCRHAWFFFSKRTRPKVTLLLTLPYTYDITNNAADYFHEDIPSLLIRTYRMQAALDEK